MFWNDHSKLVGTHAFLGASQPHWINWNDDIFIQRFNNQYANTIGTAIHELASDCIKNRMKLSKNDRHLIEITLYKIGIPKSVFDADRILENLIPFVNDSIGYHMSSEILLYYSPFCYGTTDAIGYDEKKRILRVHDYKSGVLPAKIEQLYIYCALFCLEYHVKPNSLSKIECRIYQNLQVLEDYPEPSLIEKFMDIIKIGSDKAVRLYERDAK